MNMHVEWNTDFEKYMKKPAALLILALLLICGATHASELSSADERTLIHDANVALSQQDYRTAFIKYSTLAEQGNAVAQFNLGVLYLNGQGVQKAHVQSALSPVRQLKSLTSHPLLPRSHHLRGTRRFWLVTPRVRRATFVCRRPTVELPGRSTRRVLKRLCFRISLGRTSKSSLTSRASMQTPNQALSFR